MNFDWRNVFLGALECAVSRPHDASLRNDKVQGLVRKGSSHAETNHGFNRIAVVRVPHSDIFGTTSHVPNTPRLQIN
jgi:hypothetical protein